MHDHEHEHQRDASRRQLVWALAINLVFLLVEIVGGILTHSLALLADAGHMLGDVSALGLALFVLYLARRPASGRRTFGLLRAEVVGAFVNGAGLLLIVAFIFLEAWHRIGTPQTIDGPLMLVIAVIGLGANVASVFILSRSRHENINVQGAFFHMLADSLSSAGAIVAGIVIWVWGWQTIDLIMSVIIGLLIIWSTWGFLRRTTNILLEAVPEDISYAQVKQALEELGDIDHVHDLHIWTITSGMTVLTAHVVPSEECCRQSQWWLCIQQAKKRLEESFGITHSTIEMEPCGEEECSGVSCRLLNPSSPPKGPDAEGGRSRGLNP